MADLNNLTLFLSILWDNWSQEVLSLGVSQAATTRQQLGLESKEDITGRHLKWFFTPMLAHQQEWLELLGAGCPLSLSPQSISVGSLCLLTASGIKMTVTLAFPCVSNPRDPRRSWRFSLDLALKVMQHHSSTSYWSKASHRPRSHHIQRRGLHHSVNIHGGPTFGDQYHHSHLP